MNRSGVFPCGVLILSGCALGLFFMAETLAASSDTATFTADILPGTCTVDFDSDDISLPVVRERNIKSAAANTELSADEASPNTLRVTCDDFHGARIAKLTITSDDSVTIGSSTSWFRNAARSTPDSALAVRVQYRKVGASKDWSDYLSSNDLVDASTTVVDMNSQSIPFRMSMWCAPSKEQTYVNCDGKVSASFKVSVNYP